jgi:regulator of protease activity HflC (stomatin/prohibitin superfamily)
MGGLGIFVLVILVLVVLFIFMAVKTVPQGTAFTVERFGQFTRTLQPGLSFIAPFFDRIGAKMNMQENVLDVPSQKVITKDNAIVTVDAVAFYQVIDAAKAAYEVQNLTLAMTNLAVTNIRSVMGNMALDDVLSKRQEINDTLLAIIDQATNPWGVKVLRVELKDIVPPEDMVQAMARQMKAEREKRAVILEAEGVREASIKRAEGEKQAAILEAEGRREAAFRDAEARERLAQAEAKATDMVSAAIAAHGTAATNYFLGQRYVEALSRMGTGNNAKLVFLPLEATGIMGAIAGIAEITRDAINKGGSGGGATPAPAGGPPQGPWTRG